jgi:acetyl-CoA carboxylase carboxyl transferase subunit alpha
MSTLKVPIICIVIGEGSSGGALALGVGDKIIMLENSVYSILSPEGFASILYKDATKNREAAENMKITAKDLKELEIIDEIIKEPNGGAQNNIEEISNNLKKSLVKNLNKLTKISKDILLEERYEKFRKIGKIER